MCPARSYLDSCFFRFMYYSVVFLFNKGKGFIFHPHFLFYSAREQTLYILGKHHWATSVPALLFISHSKFVFNFKDLYHLLLSYSSLKEMFSYNPAIGVVGRCQGCVSSQLQEFGFGFFWVCLGANDTVHPLWPVLPESSCFCVFSTFLPLPRTRLWYDACTRALTSL